jgi:serine/threonine-protein kinase RsbW
MERTLPHLDQAEVVKLPSVLSSVEKVEEIAEAYAARAGFDEDTVTQIAMLVREAAVNAMLHGNRSDPDKLITVSFQLTDEALIYKISDQGTGFNPDDVPDPLSPEGLLRTSGRGIFLMRAMLDEVNFRQLSPGTEITLVKNRMQKETGA